MNIMEAKALSAILSLFFVVISCTGSADKNKQAEVMSNNAVAAIPLDTTKRSGQLVANPALDPAKEWLEGIFHCEGGKPGEYCYYIEKEETSCTARFLEFLRDANEIYGPSNLTDAELPAAEARYKAKWEKIYPLYKEEMWLFGRGNDDALTIRTVTIKKLDTNKYSVFIDYGNDIKTQNEVQLLLEKNAYKIDYCKTAFVQ
jgi:hypothetical protein